jgi:histone H3/H4
LNRRTQKNNTKRKQQSLFSLPYRTPTQQSLHPQYQINTQQAMDSIENTPVVENTEVAAAVEIAATSDESVDVQMTDAVEEAVQEAEEEQEEAAEASEEDDEEEADESSEDEEPKADGSAAAAPAEKKATKKRSASSEGPQFSTYIGKVYKEHVDPNKECSLTSKASKLINAILTKNTEDIAAEAVSLSRKVGRKGIDVSDIEIGAQLAMAHPLAKECSSYADVALDKYNASRPVKKAKTAEDAVSSPVAGSEEQ